MLLVCCACTAWVRATRLVEKGTLEGLSSTRRAPGWPALHSMHLPCPAADASLRSHLLQATTAAPSQMEEQRALQEALDLSRAEYKSMQGNSQVVRNNMCWQMPGLHVLGQYGGRRLQYPLQGTNGAPPLPW